jgi:hypothetical protein
LPAWSSDGTRIAFTSSRDGNREIYIMDADGVNPVRLTASGSADAGPAWSPDGTKIAFWSERTGTGDIYTMDSDGSNVVRLTTSLALDATPDWQILNNSPVGLFEPDTGRWNLRTSTGNVASFFFGNPGDLPVMGDWDCNGIDTPGLYRQSEGFVYLRNTNTQGVADISYFIGNPEDIPLAGDFNGDGCDTVSVYRPSEGRFYVFNALGSGGASIGPAEFPFLYGNRGDKPFTGDFDGDGVDTMGLHRESVGFIYLRNENSQGIADLKYFLGNPGDRVVAGDWTKDGRDTVGLFRPVTTAFLLHFVNAPGFANEAFVFGQPSWLPVQGTFGF